MTSLICFVSFLSGAAALLFETLWFRLLGHTLGSGLWASSVVLAAFMAGLGLGNAIAFRRTSGWRRPFAAYATVEAIIGGSGIALVLLLPALNGVLAPVLRALDGVPTLVDAIRVLVALLLLLAPATAMGLTLPILVKCLASSDSNFGRVLGRLYGWNTLGAVVGALAGELALFDLLGLRGSGFVAAALNGVAALAILRPGRGRREADETAPPPLSPVSWRRPAPLAILGAGALAGGTLLGLEVLWFRFLQLFVAGTGLIFALMLSLVLLGISLGGLIASRWLGARPTDHRFAPAVALLASVAVLASYIAFGEGFGLYPRSSLRPVQDPWLAYGMTIGLCGPVSIASGILFTLLGRAARDELHDETKAAAALTFANTFGAALGSLGAGLVGIPILGIERSLYLAGLAYVGVALLALPALRSDPDARRRPSQAAGLAGLLAVLMLALFPFGLMQNRYVPLGIGHLLNPTSRVIDVREGATETASYIRRDVLGVPREVALITNGYRMSGSGALAQRYMNLFAYWPAAVHPDPRRALLISYGVGTTASALTHLSTLEHIDVVDISSTVLDMSRAHGLFPEGHPLDDPRVTVHVEDGRFFLQTTPHRFDIITGEPPPPVIANVVNLYSREYFELMHDALESGGIATYWLPVYQIGLYGSRSIARAFCDAFPDCSLWNGGGEEWMLVGSRDGSPPFAAAHAERLWRSPTIGATLRSNGIPDAAALSTLFLGDASFLDEWTRDVEPVEDNHPGRILTDVPGSDDPDAVRTAEYQRVMEPAARLERFRSSPWLRSFWPPSLLAQAEQRFEAQSLLDQHFAGRRASADDFVRVLAGPDRATTIPLLLGTDAHELAIARDQEAEGLRGPGIAYLNGVADLSQGRFDRAFERFDGILAGSPGATRVAELRIIAGHMAGRSDLLRPEDTVARERGQATWFPGFWAWTAGLGPT